MNDAFARNDLVAEWGARIAPPDEAARAAARDKWNQVAKPIGSLGVLEADVERIAALTGTADVDIARRAVVVLCADNGVVAQGVSQSPQSVTTAVANNVARGVSSVCAMCRPIGVDVLAVDMGMAEPSPDDAVLDRHIARGTADISEGPAMTRAQAARAIQVGIELVADFAARGYGLLATGEMGIGNTTTSAAMAAAFLGLSPEEACGRGSGLTDAGLLRKRAAIGRAIQVNAPDANDALDVLAKLGGFDIAGMAGIFIGGAIHRVPIVVDGLISAVAAYTAHRLCPACADAMLASHVSAEPAARLLLARLGLDAPIHAGLRLGEGTGAACLIPLLDMAISLYNGTTFAATGIDAYKVDLR